MKALRYLFSPASVADFPCFLLMGLLSGAIALIPYVGWLLGISFYLLWHKSRNSAVMPLELPFVAVLWLVVKVLSSVLL